ncbi:MAG: hypothetical protein WC334_10910 [Kiritimatiellales bacterium]|jgi:hypothetical protein
MVFCGVYDPYRFLSRKIMESIPKLSINHNSYAIWIPVHLYSDVLAGKREESNRLYQGGAGASAVAKGFGETQPRTLNFKTRRDGAFHLVAEVLDLGSAITDRGYNSLRLCEE